MRCKRRKILVHRFQLKYSFYISIGMMLIMVLTMLNTYVDMASITNKVLAEKGRTYILIWELVTPLLFIKIFFITVVIILVSILLSHRVAGPIYRFNNIFEKIAKGELNIKEIKLRRKDELHDEAYKLFSMIKGLKSAINNIKEDVDTLVSQDDLNSSETREIIVRLREKLSFFKI